MRYKAIVAGTSAGGFYALKTIFAPLPEDFGVPILVVQHRAPAEREFFTYALDQETRLTVKEAEDKEAVNPGYIYVAPANYHLLVEHNATLSLSIDAKVRYARPSVDVLFETAAETYRDGLVGVILTGANADGTNGLKKIKELGGLTLAQDPKMAEAGEMPAAAIKAGVVDMIGSLEDIASVLGQLSIPQE
jgi:two-component system chemotaxis response regulator CheB